MFLLSLQKKQNKDMAYIIPQKGWICELCTFCFLFIKLSYSFHKIDKKRSKTFRPCGYFNWLVTILSYILLLTRLRKKMSGYAIFPTLYLLNLNYPISILLLFALHLMLKFRNRNLYLQVFFD